jgi:ATP-binding cassette, subfamily F, member 3
MPNAPEAKVRGRAAEMGFSAEMANTKVGSLSGGERARLLLGLATFHGRTCSFSTSPRTISISKRAPRSSKRSANIPAPCSSSPTTAILLDSCAERLWRVADGTVQPYDGDLDQYRREVLGRSGAERLGGGGKAARGKGSGAKQSELAPLRKKIATLEAEIEKLEKEIASLDGKLADSASLSGNAAEIARLGRERAQKSERLAKAEEEWLAASARREELSA